MFSLLLNNYKGFQKQKLNISKINILIGENSSGKSSLIKFLLALKQSTEKPNDQEANLILSGKYIDLGNYQEAVYCHHIHKRITFKFTYGEQYHNFYLQFVSIIPPFIEENKEKDKRARVPKKEYLKNIKLFIGKNSCKETEVEFGLSKKLDSHNSIRTIFLNKSIGKISVTYPDEKDQKEDEYVYFRRQTRNS